MACVFATAYTEITTVQKSHDRLYKQDLANVRNLTALLVSYNGMLALMLSEQLAAGP